MYMYKVITCTCMYNVHTVYLIYSHMSIACTVYIHCTYIHAFAVMHMHMHCMAVSDLSAIHVQVITYCLLDIQ